jgi:hypothetical protein
MLPRCPGETKMTSHTSSRPSGRPKLRPAAKAITGSNVITGYRQGSVTAIKRVAEEIVVGLNERRSPNRGRVQLTQLKKTPKRAAS